MVHLPLASVQRAPLPTLKFQCVRSRLFDLSLFHMLDVILMRCPALSEHHNKSLSVWTSKLSTNKHGEHQQQRPGSLEVSDLLDHHYSNQTAYNSGSTPVHAGAGHMPLSSMKVIRSDITSASQMFRWKRADCEQRCVTNKTFSRGSVLLPPKLR